MKFKRLLAVLLTITMLATLIPSVLVSAEGDINDGVIFTKTLVMHRQFFAQSADGPFLLFGNIIK